jgi:hypothetical protein
MAAPLNSSKQTVNLAAGPRVSRIRRSPLPPPRKEPMLDREDREKLSVTFGVIAVAIALSIAIFIFAAYSGWSPREQHLHIALD